jgi:BexC/CtrB/KpsE family polysaccharide export inner-membrane protein
MARMSDGQSDALGSLRALTPARGGSLTRRVLAQKPQPPTLRERFLTFDWSRFLKYSFLLIVAVPTILAAVYNFLLATPTYVAEARFAVRGAADRPLIESYMASGTLDALPSPSADRDKAGKAGRPSEAAAPASGRASQIATLALGAVAGGSGSIDPFIVSDFISSHDIVRALDEDGWLRQRFTDGDPDWLQRLPAGVPIEHLVRYWRSFVTASMDTNTGLLNLRVTAFTAEDALAIAQRVLGQSEALVNRMSERARRDRLEGAEAEVKRAETRYLEAETAMRDLRGQDAIIDPKQQAQGSFSLLLELISARIALDVQLRMIVDKLDDDAPQVRSLRKRIAALDAEIAKAKAALTDASGDAQAASNYLAAFEQRETERRLAGVLYSTALDALERARLETERQAAYLAVFAPPHLPAHATGPDAPGMVITLFLAALLAWGVITLLVAASRDHLS